MLNYLIKKQNFKGQKHFFLNIKDNMRKSTWKGNKRYLMKNNMKMVNQQHQMYKMVKVVLSMSDAYAVNYPKYNNNHEYYHINSISESSLKTTMTRQIGFTFNSFVMFVEASFFPSICHEIIHFLVSISIDTIYPSFILGPPFLLSV